MILPIFILNVLNYMLLLLSRKKRCKKNSIFSFNWSSIHDCNIFSIYFFIKSTSAKIFPILSLFVVICSIIVSFFRIKDNLYDIYIIFILKFTSLHIYMRNFFILLIFYIYLKYLNSEE